MSTDTPDGKFAGTVRVGDKGQIVIPKAARALLGIAPGDTLLLLADENRGIAMQKSDHLYEILDRIARGEEAQKGSAQ